MAKTKRKYTSILLQGILRPAAGNMYSICVCKNGVIRKARLFSDVKLNVKLKK
jgi:hypothetical protein